MLVVGFFLRGVRDPVLALSRTGSQAVESPAVLGVIDVVFKKQLRIESRIKVKTDATKISYGLIELMQTPIS